MFFKSLTVIAVTVFANLEFATLAHAQSDLSVFEEEGWTLGAGITYGTTIIKGADDKVLPFPYIAYNKGNFHIGIDGVSYDIVSSNSLNVEVIGNLRDSSLGANDIQEAFPTIDRSIAFEAGLAASFDVNMFSFGASILQDLTGQHNGMEANLSISAGTMVDNILISLGGGSKYQDNDLSLYMYGVKEEEVTPTLAKFTPQANWTPYAELSVGMLLNKKSALFGVVTHEFIPNEVEISPLVDNNSASTIAIIYMRKF